MRRIVVTGGPGAGKTAILEIARHHFHSHVEFVREAASIVFGGGFPRNDDVIVRAAGQRAIYHVQQELETIAAAALGGEVILCDRGTLDGLAYWPNSSESFFADLHTSHAAELARYDAVIHLRTPTRRDGYHNDALRIERVSQAETIDARLLEIWKDHPRRFVVESTHEFLEKAKRTLAIIRDLLPPE